MQLRVVSMITCTTTGGRYVCSATDVNPDPGPNFNPLAYGHGKLFRWAVKEYGRRAFTHETLGSGYPTRKKLLQAESQFIRQYGTLWPQGYNLIAGTSDIPDIERSAKLKHPRRSNYLWGSLAPIRPSIIIPPLSAAHASLTRLARLKYCKNVDLGNIRRELSEIGVDGEAAEKILKRWVRYEV